MRYNLIMSAQRFGSEFKDHLLLELTTESLYCHELILPRFSKCGSFLPLSKKHQAPHSPPCWEQPPQVHGTPLLRWKRTSHPRNILEVRHHDSSSRCSVSSFAISLTFA